MNAVITDKYKDGKVRRNRKEAHYCRSYIGAVWNGETVETPVEIRLYRTNARVYACIWVNDSRTGTQISGGGYAAGYGYCKDSAAAGEAIEDAGIQLSRDIKGRGTEQVILAVQAICMALGYNDVKVIQAHA